MADTERTHSTARNIAKIVYILYLAELLIGPVLGLIGVILAYVYRSDAPERLASHYRFQIRTFWIGYLYLIIAGIAVLMGVVAISDNEEFIGVLLFIVGAAVLVFLVIWLIIRCIKGLKYELREEAYPDPKGWFF